MLLHIDLADGERRLGGSALAHAFDQVTYDVLLESTCQNNLHVVM